MARLDHITDTLYISDALSVISSDGKRQMQELNIQRVLTASGTAIMERQRLAGVEYFHLFMMDMISQDILGSGILQKALEYIEKAMQENVNVLVHCEAGISRSVTLATAYVMRRSQWSAENALVFVQRKRPIASPNLSFRQQLKVFEQLEFCADPNTLATSPIYRNYCADTGKVPVPIRSLGAVGRSALHTHRLPRLAGIPAGSPSPSFGGSNQHSDKPKSSDSNQDCEALGGGERDSGVQSSASSLMSTPQHKQECPDEWDFDSTKTNEARPLDETNGERIARHSLIDSLPWAKWKFTCRRCRCDLFYDVHVMRHSGAVGRTGKGVEMGHGSEAQLCPLDYLITPMEWMSLGQHQGKIHCPKCREKLGQYNWSGNRCEGDGVRGCGAFVTPWIHIQNGRVDQLAIGAHAYHALGQEEKNYAVATPASVG